MRIAELVFLYEGFLFSTHTNLYSLTNLRENIGGCVVKGNKFLVKSLVAFMAIGVTTSAMAVMSVPTVGMRKEMLANRECLKVIQPQALVTRPDLGGTSMRVISLTLTQRVKLDTRIIRLSKCVMVLVHRLPIIVIILMASLQRNHANRHNRC